MTCGFTFVKKQSFLFSYTVRYNYTVIYLLSYTVLFYTIMTRARGFTDQGLLFWWTFLRYGFSDVRPGRILIASAGRLR